MIHDPHLQARAAQPYAGIRMSVPMDGISGAVDEAFPELFGCLGANGIPPGGAPFIRYLVIDMAADLELDFGVPVGVPVSGSGRVQPGVLPEGRYAVVRHTGTYDGLIAANAALQDWARENRISFDAWDSGKGQAWRSRVEYYLTNPAEEPDPAKWEVDVAYLTVPDA